MGLPAAVSAHSFHIPVMGTGFMIDAPLRVARYGISSVISLVDDILIEQMRKYHCQQHGEPYEEIPDGAEDARARRITAYLNLLDVLIARQLAELRSSPFEPGSEITRYFDLLPEGPLAQQYRDMLETAEPALRLEKQERLRGLVVPGTIDVNIMSKGDRDLYCNGEKLPLKYSDASAAFRGFAESTVSSSIVFSAGMNPRLYGWPAEFPDFFPDERGELKKKIVLKVSDYHSGAVQGKFLAKKGLWVSEYRIESGLNCGGHAFATKGLLLGPILAEFQKKRQELVEQIHAVYAKALRAKGIVRNEPLPIRITAQGGIGTAEEDRLLRDYYGADGTGWGTPFLLVPEVTNLDQEHLDKLCAAVDGDVYLSDSSPFGLPFWNLRNSASEEARRARIAKDRPGSACPKGFVKLFNTEFTETPICTASRQYQKLKLAELEKQEMPEARREALREMVMAKSCICHDLAGGATRKNDIDRNATPAVCCGPNIVNFNRVMTLEEIVGHIYGRISLLAFADRPHMFLREIELYLDHFADQQRKARLGLVTLGPEYFAECRTNMLAGVEHYRQFAQCLDSESCTAFLERLAALRIKIEAME